MFSTTVDTDNYNVANVARPSRFYCLWTKSTLEFGILDR